MLNFRPHHFLCTLCFQGKGYSLDFIRHYKNIVKQLKNHQLIKITAQTDSICQPCPHKRGVNCVSQTKIEKLDHNHFEALKLNQLKNNPIILTWQQAKNLIKKNLTVEKFHDICAPCEWKKYGLCEKVIKNFLMS